MGVDTLCGVFWLWGSVYSLEGLCVCWGNMQHHVVCVGTISMGNSTWVWGEVDKAPQRMAMWGGL